MAYGEIIDQKMLKTVRVAAVSVDSTTGDWNDNLGKITDWTKQAADSGVHLILFQELSLSGFIPNHPTGACHTETNKTNCAADSGLMDRRSGQRREKV